MEKASKPTDTMVIEAIHAGVSRQYPSFTLTRVPGAIITPWQSHTPRYNPCGELSTCVRQTRLRLSIARFTRPLQRWNHLVFFDPTPGQTAALAWFAHPHAGMGIEPPRHSHHPNDPDPVGNHPADGPLEFSPEYTRSPRRSPHPALRSSHSCSPTRRGHERLPPTMDVA